MSNWFEDNAAELEAEAGELLRATMNDSKEIASQRLKAAALILERTTPAKKHVAVDASAGATFIYISAVGQAAQVLKGETPQSLPQGEG